MMKKNGFIDSSGAYTSKLYKRNNMTADERALTRGDATAITHDYDITTNRTTQNT
jgi:hypothetical protein